MIKWLMDQRWHFVISADGWPKVAVDEFNRHMVGNSKMVPKESEPQLNLS